MMAAMSSLNPPRRSLGRSAARGLGIARSLAMYYGIPLRAGRLARFYAEFVRPGSLCFDIGAHAGNRVRCWRRLGARVVAVEPQADFVHLLRLLYGRDPDVAIVHKGLGREPGTARLLVSERAPTVTTLSRDWIASVQSDDSFRGVDWVEGDDVELTTLDELIRAHGMPQFVKIDVEGYEAEVLAGVTTPIPALSFEYLPAARDIAVDCVQRLCELGRYRFNWSAGESQRFGSETWLDADAIRRFIDALTERSGSGDIYARQVDADGGSAASARAAI